MKRSDAEIEELFGRQFAMEAMITQLAWAWASSQPHPPTALASYLRPIEQSMQKLDEDPATRGPATAAARETVRQIALELERTLQKAALLRASSEGKAQ